jgi:predicted AlkP superfamily pyrophosphatase or phosphodiesterase
MFSLAAGLLLSSILVAETVLAADQSSTTRRSREETTPCRTSSSERTVFGGGALLAEKPAASPKSNEPAIKLVLQITVDQLRGDLPRLFKQRFGQGGFRKLMEQGVFYVNANYMHADTETGPGHATLVTGGQPAQHGIVGGDWWDQSKKRIMYSVEDNDFKVHSDHIDTDIGKTTGGRAPTNLESTTLGDEMFIASEATAKVFAVSGKDRSAIIPGGRVGKAFWLEHGNFVTSTYYFKQMPDWLVSWNSKKLADTYRDKNWDLLQDRNSYWRKDKDDLPWEGGYKHLGRTMPKKLGTTDQEAYYKGLEHTIVGDELVLAFTKDLIARENLGCGKTTDYLSVSFSSTDMVGHTWGVGSLEAEDNMLRVDRNLADLFAFVDKKVGLDKTLIVLSADHGVADVTEFIQSLGFPAKRVDPQELPKQVNDALKKRFSTELDLVQTFVYPYIYLNLDNVAQLNLKVDEVERAAADASMKFPGIYFAATRSDIITGRVPAMPHMQRVTNTFHPRRSGNVHLVADQHALLMHYPWNLKTGLHGSVWTYDTYVPIMFLVPGVPPKQCSRPVGPQDIAPTISTILGIKPPSGSVGTPLPEVVDAVK